MPVEYALAIAGAVVAELNPASRTLRRILATYPTPEDAADHITELAVRGRPCGRLTVLLLVTEEVADNATTALRGVAGFPPLKSAAPAIGRP